MRTKFVDSTGAVWEETASQRGAGSSLPPHKKTAQGDALEWASIQSGMHRNIKWEKIISSPTPAETGKSPPSIHIHTKGG